MSYEEENEGIEYPNYQQPYLTDSNKGQVLLKMLETDDVLENCEMHLKGYMLNRQSGDWVPRMIKDVIETDDGEEKIVETHSPLVNEHGISRIMAMMSTQVNRLTMTTNLDKKEVYMLAKQMSLWIVNQIFINHEKWESHPDDWDTIVDIVDQTYFKILKQAQQNGFRDMLKNYNVREMLLGQKNQDKGGRSMYERVTSPFRG